MGFGEERIPGTFLIDHISNQKLLAVVSGQNGDFLGGDALESGIHVSCHDVFGLSFVLIKMGIWAVFPKL